MLGTVRFPINSPTLRYRYQLPLTEIVPLRYYFTTTVPLRLVQTARGAYRIDLSILAGVHQQFIHLLYYQINAIKALEFSSGD